MGASTERVGRASGATGYRIRRGPGGLPHKEVAEIMGRFFDVLNTLIAVLVLLVVVAGINALLYFGYRPSEAPAPPYAERGGPQTTLESTELRTGSGEATRSASAPRSTSPTRPSATASATASATTSATASAAVGASSFP